MDFKDKQQTIKNVHFSLDKKTVVNIIYIENEGRHRMIDADETGRYKKRTASNVSRVKNRSRHKHQYVDVLISVGPSNSLYTGRICTVCGKIKDLKLATDRVEIDGKIYYRMLTDEKIREKYKDLKEYHIDNHSQKYVKLEKNNGTVN